MFRRSLLAASAAALGLCLAIATAASSTAAAQLIPPPTRAPSAAASSGGATTQAAVILGPRGYRALLLRMAPKQAARTGLFSSHPGWSGHCALWPAKPGQPFSAAAISKKRGVVVIYAGTAKLQTPEGMHLGMTPAQVHDLYLSFDPSSAHQPSGVGIGVPGYPAFSYALRFDSLDHIAGLRLEAGQDCFS